MLSAPTIRSACNQTLYRLSYSRLQVTLHGGPEMTVFQDHLRYDPTEGFLQLTSHTAMLFSPFG